MHEIHATTEAKLRWLELARASGYCVVLVFVGLEGPPVALERKGLKIVLLSSQLGSLKAGTPVFYRGIEVGAVQDSHLGADATTVTSCFRKPFPATGSYAWTFAPARTRSSIRGR